MRRRYVTLGLFVVVLALQWPVWFGKGGWFKVWERQTEVAKRDAANEERKLRNAAVEADVKDLKDGTGAIEERARQDMGMVKKGEVFIHVLQGGATAAPAMSSPSAQK